MKKRKRKSSGSHRSEARKLFSMDAIFISVVVIVLGLVSLYYFGVFGGIAGAVECGDMACYYEYLLDCKKSYVINEDDNYVYRYEILGDSGNSYCYVDVRLIRIKSGQIDTEDLESLGMSCRVNRFEEIFPEADMLACSGRLREELQEIIIDRLHNEILQNLGQVREGLES